DAEVDHLGCAAHGGGDVGIGHTVNLGRGGGVDVGSFAEGFDHGGVIGERGHDAEFDLRVVAAENLKCGIWNLRFPGDEGFADFSAGFGADGDVLEVGI